MNIYFLDSDAYQFDDSTRSLVRSIAEDTEQELRVLLPQLESRIHLVIMPSKDVIPETGESATTLTPFSIQMRVNPWDERGVEQIMKNKLRSTLFHEAHHAARATQQPWRYNLTANAITEGLATAFERDNGGPVPPWGEYDTATIRSWTEELLALDSATTNHQQYFFNHPDGRRWIAYRVGTYIVDQAIMRNEGLTAASLVVESPDAILKLAGLE